MDLDQFCTNPNCGHLKQFGIKCTVGPWIDCCPFCVEDRQPQFLIDDSGFLLELNGEMILDPSHWILKFCKKQQWQAFCVSKDGSGNVCGLRRTCEEWEDNSNKGWSFARRTVEFRDNFRNPSTFAKKRNFVKDLAVILSASVFHVWPSDRQRDPEFVEYETDYYVNLGLKNGEDIQPGSFVIEEDTFIFVDEVLRYGESALDAKGKALLKYFKELDVVQCLGKDRPSDYDISGKLVDRWSVPLIMLKETDKTRLDQILSWIRCPPIGQPGSIPSFAESLAREFCKVDPPPPQPQQVVAGDTWMLINPDPNTITEKIDEMMNAVQANRRPPPT